MVICSRCQKDVKRYEDHQNFYGGFICQKYHISKSTSIKTLYHQTSLSIASLILKQGLKPSSILGMAGTKGIYFALKPEETHHKCRQMGVILECRVDIGNILKISPNGDVSLSPEALKQRGDFQSVFIPRTRGNEYVIYDPKRVINIKILKD
jgi:hypothetical protein